MKGESGSNMLFFKHSVEKIEDKLSLAGGRMGNAGTMQVGLAADEQFKAHLVSLDLNTHMEGAAFAMLLLGWRELLGGERKPVKPDQRSPFQVSFQVSYSLLFACAQPPHRLYRLRVLCYPIFQKY